MEYHGGVIRLNRAGRPQPSAGGGVGRHVRTGFEGLKAPGRRRLAGLAPAGHSIYPRSGPRWWRNQDMTDAEIASRLALIAAVRTPRQAVWNDLVSVGVDHVIVRSAR